MSEVPKFSRGGGGGLKREEYSTTTKEKYRTLRSSLEGDRALGTRREYPLRPSRKRD